MKHDRLEAAAPQHLLDGSHKQPGRVRPPSDLWVRNKSPRLRKHSGRGPRPICCLGLARMTIAAAIRGTLELRRLCALLAFATGALLMFAAGLHAQGERFVFALTREGQAYGIADFDIAKFIGIPY